MIQPHEITAWLGPVKLTPEQLSTFTRLVTDWTGDNPDADDTESGAAWVAALETATGELDVPALARADQAAQLAAAEARSRLRQAVQMGLTVGRWPSEDAAAAAAGVTRMTIRAWAGK